MTMFAEPARSQASWEYEWGRALMEDFRYDDMAERVFTDLRNRPDKEQKNLGLLGMQKLKRRQAQRADDPAETSKLNTEALAMLRQVAKNLP